MINEEENYRKKIIGILSAEKKNEIEKIRLEALDTLKKYCGDEVYLRGLVEFSNICSCDCFYCGIRKSNKSLTRYMLSKREILNIAIWCAHNGYGSFVLQSGERSDAGFIDFVEDLVKTIKKETKSEFLPEGLGITLCVGEQTKEIYERFFEAGAHRYLLRIETTDEELFRNLHPADQKLGNRIKCLDLLKEVGYQVGTGVMIGLPGQTLENLANDILFFREHDIDMIGMGPFLVHRNTPLNEHYDQWLEDKERIFSLSLKMIAATRIILKDVNIASTTALETINPRGKEAGLDFGANVVMPLMTPENVRREYLLYDGKPLVDSYFEDPWKKASDYGSIAGRTIAVNEWGDSKHFSNRNK